MFWRVRHFIKLNKVIRPYFSDLRVGYLDWMLQYHLDILGGVKSSELQRPVDNKGDPIPWLTYPAIDYLSQFDYTSASIFEYGSGQSSLFWAARCKHITSVESDKEWLAYCQQHARSNQRLVFRDEGAPEAYAAAIDDFDESYYDVIVIDGKHRALCARRALPRLAKHGMIILDNSEWCPQTVEILRLQGLLQVDFIGIGPLNRYTWCTSLFLQPTFKIPRLKTENRIEFLGRLDENHDGVTVLKRPRPYAPKRASS